MAENNNNSGNQTQIIVALITLVGVVTTALLGNKVIWRLVSLVLTFRLTFNSCQLSQLSRWI